MLMVQLNPFIIEGYLSPEYFCDRVEETALLTRHLTNRCNVALIAPRRLGKSGLIYNCFQQENIREQYHCIYIDIYDTKIRLCAGQGNPDGTQAKGQESMGIFPEYAPVSEVNYLF